jgi:hypothetical protein
MRINADEIVNLRRQLHDLGRIGFLRTGGDFDRHRSILPELSLSLRVTDG